MSKITKENKEKLDALVKAEGFDSTEALLEKYVFDSVVPAICVNPNCTYTTEMEPDQAGGHCEVCGTKTVVSCLVLAGII
jgi:hypothetical protein